MLFKIIVILHTLGANVAEYTVPGVAMLGLSKCLAIFTHAL